MPKSDTNDRQVQWIAHTTSVRRVVGEAILALVVADWCWAKKVYWLLVAAVLDDSEGNTVVEGVGGVVLVGVLLMLCKDQSQSGTAYFDLLKTRRTSGSKGRNKYTDLNQVTKDSKQKSEHTVLMYVYLYVTESTVRFEQSPR